MRTRLLAELAQPGSAVTLARRVELSRQKVNHHLHTLEKHGLIRLVEERRRGSVTERWLRASAAAYVIAPSVLGPLEPVPGQRQDTLPVRWLLALAARLVREVGELITDVHAASNQQSTFGRDSALSFATPTDGAAFAQELTAAVDTLVAKYHGESPGSYEHRLIIAVHPKGPEVGKRTMSA
ncbi:ArsR/SmtB family transcription factor [Amycolatopsis magusensis]|uniref:ArsR/SmtB family transcription factor n=1 Tax=Amycolatopsis magusensis TaxID=882444 RepID=UPI00378E259A